MAASRGTTRSPANASASTKRRVRSGGGGTTTDRPKSTKENSRNATVVGRPRILWTHSQQRRLLRLYLFTPPSELPLSQILALLTEGNFIPKERRTQTELRKLLSDDKYWRLRPKDRDCMRRRLEFLRAARIEAQKRRKAGSRQHRPVAIDLLRSGSVGRRPHTGVTSIDYPFTPEFLSNENFSSLPLAFNLTDAADSIADRDVLGQPLYPSGPSPHSLRSSTSDDSDATQTNRSRTARVSFLKRILPNRTPSFLADVASLFSGLSQKSVSSGSTKRNSGSSYPSDVSSSRGWRGVRGSLTPTPDLLSPPPEDEEQVFSNMQMDPVYPTSNHEENAAVIAACCHARTRMLEEDPSMPWCVHRRLIQAIAMVRERPEEPVEFAVTREEADLPDGLGNILLHIAALWGAPISILRAIVKETTNVSATNYRRETFIHVYQPSTDLAPAPAAFGSLTRLLRRMKFNFRQLDKYKRTCINRLILNPAFSLEALDAFFSEVSETTGVWLVSNRSLKGERLFHCFCRKLYDLNMEIPDSSSDGSDFLYRQQSYLQRFATKSLETRLGPGPSMTASTPHTVSPHTPPSASTSHASGKTPLTPKSQLTSLDKEVDFNKIVRHLLHDDYDVNEREEQTGRTRLMILLQALVGPGHAQEGAPDALIRKMLTSGARLDIVDKMGNTALHYAAELGVPAVVGLLCLYNADVSAVNRRGETPLQLARSGIFRKDTLGGIRKWTRFLECGSILMHYADANANVAARTPGTSTDEGSSRSGKSPMLLSEGSPSSRSDDSALMSV